MELTKSDKKNPEISGLSAKSSILCARSELNARSHNCIIAKFRDQLIIVLMVMEHFFFLIFYL